MPINYNDLGIDRDMPAARSIAAARREIRRATKDRPLTVEITLTFKRPISRTSARKHLWSLLHKIDPVFREAIFNTKFLSLWAIGIFRDDEEQVVCSAAIHFSSRTAPREQDIRTIEKVALSFWAKICVTGQARCQALPSPGEFVAKLVRRLSYRARLADVVLSSSLDAEFSPKHGGRHDHS